MKSNASYIQIGDEICETKTVIDYIHKTQKTITLFTAKTVAPRQHRYSHGRSIHTNYLKQNAGHTDTFAGREILHQNGRAEGHHSNDHVILGRTIGARREHDHYR